MPYRVIKTIDGRRGSFLALAGLLFVPQSMQWVFTIGMSRERFEVLAFLPPVVELWHIGIVFSILGLLGMFIGVFSKRLSPKTVSWGYVAAMAPAFLASALFFLAALFVTPMAWPAVVSHGVVVALIYLGSAWPNPLGTPIGPPPETKEVPTVTRKDVDGTVA